MVSTIIRDASTLDGHRVDVVLDGELVADGRSTDVSADNVIDARGGLLLPAFIDTHVHLDKVLTRDRLAEHDGTLRGAIDSIHAAKRLYTVDEVRERAVEVIRTSVLTGTTRLRSHVDVDTIGSLTPLHGVRAAAQECSSIADVQTIAFPQEGIVRDPGTEQLLVEAMQQGADVVGGMPHWERSEDEQREHVRICFDIAERFGADVDMHVDETDDGSVRTLGVVAEETTRRGWHGRVTVGHVCALAAADQDYANRVIAQCAAAEITVVANPVTNLVLQGRGDRGLIRRGTTRIRELMAAGVNVAFGQDCVSDGFYPFGRGDMLEVALISAHTAHLTTADELSAALEAVTNAPATAWRLGGTYGLRPGARADLQLYAAPTWPEVLRRQDAPTHVWHRGRLVATTRISRNLQP
jgi:cytosine/creatinine deaminase